MMKTKLFSFHVVFAIYFDDFVGKISDEKLPQTRKPAIMYKCENAMLKKQRKAVKSFCSLHHTQIHMLSVQRNMLRNVV